MKNNLSDLNNYLFEQIERINDDSLSDLDLDKAISKARTIVNLAETVIKNQELQLKAATILSEAGLLKNSALPILLGTHILEEKHIEKQ